MTVTEYKKLSFQDQEKIFWSLNSPITYREVSYNLRTYLKKAYDFYLEAHEIYKPDRRLSQIIAFKSARKLENYVFDGHYEFKKYKKMLAKGNKLLVDEIIELKKKLDSCEKEIRTSNANWIKNTKSGKSELN